MQKMQLFYIFELNEPKEANVAAEEPKNLNGHLVLISKHYSETQEEKKGRQMHLYFSDQIFGKSSA
ncbi:8008_t:CDS:1, partial [Ambispora gerdemannii]